MPALDKDSLDVLLKETWKEFPQDKRQEYQGLAEKDGQRLAFFLNISQKYFTHLPLPLPIPPLHCLLNPPLSPQRKRLTCIMSQIFHFKLLPTILPLCHIAIQVLFRTETNVQNDQRANHQSKQVFSCSVVKNELLWFA